jgi:hypothetical protein
MTMIMSPLFILGMQRVLSHYSATLPSTRSLLATIFFHLSYSTKRILVSKFAICNAINGVLMFKK